MTELKLKLQKQFRELQARRDAILAASGPLRAQRDQVANEARARELTLNAQIREIEKDLPKIDEDLAMLARATGGRRMSDVGATK